MSDPKMRYRLTTARRRRPGVGSFLAAALPVLIAVVVLLLEIRDRDAEAPTPATPTPPRPTATVPAPTMTPIPEPLVERSSDWTIAAAPTPPPLWPAPVPSRAPRAATPTPSISQCVAFRWGAGQSLAAWGQVLVEIEVSNRCRRALEPVEIWFRVTGYRDGALIQTASGHPFRTLFPGRSETFAIGLPGSIDWYEEITVEIVE